ncbi:hypothetical protein CE143_02450 [Photorhabdus luminescens]|uniref:D-alanine--poly(Phosphoribitol) ligase n=2 Tax=Photorhabdus TaxID=29487 RepID=A0A2S8Q9F3_9GAMM|nr:MULTISPECIES: AMP-binding protein [Photorhabdus]PQQ29721.1 hypothetical protein C6H66_00995 [Photorhabdus hindustanensis]QXF32164.1 hypothetical protein B0X70_02465 [Photorhabdus akhurstii]UJD73955.1 hypothetical protein CE143_02450 [Photorhabdus luminescens]
MKYLNEYSESNFDLLINDRIIAPSHPDNPAIVGSDQVIYWRDLYDEIKKWHSKYLELNLNRNTPLILYGHKEANFLVSIYACITYKIPFIPIDIIYPTQRLLEIASLSNTPYYYDVISNTFKTTNVDYIEFDEDSVAYIMFTSGSTGKPKGVVIGRESVYDLMRWMYNDFKLGEKPVFMNQALFNFDLSMYETFGTLVYGGTCICISQETTTDSEKFYQALNYYQPTVWVSTPSFSYKQLLSQDFNSSFLKNLKHFLFCGEILSKNLVKHLRKRFPSAIIYNTYGPTEATVATTLIEISDQHLHSEMELLPIGESRSGSTLTLENDEIVISGAHVMRKYIGAKAEDNNRLTINQDGMRSFRTGDIGKLIDNIWYCFGREDNQIKLNGYRIELHEIEERLMNLPIVDSAVVLPLKKEDGSIVRLVAFCKFKTIIDKENLVNLLKKNLPSYMIPSEFINIDNFPVTNNSKVDTKSLLSRYNNNECEIIK